MEKSVLIPLAETVEDDQHKISARPILSNNLDSGESDSSESESANYRFV